ncbi:YiiX/YebB-like N1pC/P60 family cysteine hydrolase [Desulfovibrio litoralis]|uniref:Permuted papain-like amidase enzyme, YaeF/YiiX, C92 family n=1 Tax=Desulfovibrio litoralis DSM 11393 TaxID=1121455 RepID=A0A1M7SGT9_9BACT|nr:YiiX/YebB-like N1pC/P60 family cysteine hydrolase [Desulfovibrio litoralis]SHN57693.1 Permuted papain-like amidase enzyme, YaeF/YiiX, C92 family [Desulfovibrio litoralis DSM 11393]
MTQYLRLIFYFFIMILFSLSSACSVKKTLSESDRLKYSQHELALNEVLQNGDWLVVRGTHLSDNLVASLTDMPLSHAGIYDADKKEVIESTGVDGVKAVSLESFINKSTRVMVIRPMFASDPQKARKAVEKAQSLIGKSYDFSGLAGLGSSERYYCTELVIKVYQPFEIKMQNPIPPIIKPGQMYHWGRIVFDSGAL